MFAELVRKSPKLSAQLQSFKAVSCGKNKVVQNGPKRWMLQGTVFIPTNEAVMAVAAQVEAIQAGGEQELERCAPSSSSTSSSPLLLLFHHLLLPPGSWACIS